MKILVDTHVLLWWLFDDPRLCNISRDIITNPDNEIFVSSASAWEIATKFRIGKIPEAEELILNFHSILAKEQFKELSISIQHSLKSGTLKMAHRDPFDRMLIAQSILEELPLITYDSIFKMMDDLQVIPF